MNLKPRDPRCLIYARMASSLLLLSLFVILWGAYVRASGSGAGCGEHWPLCNGVVLPVEPAAKTLIELTHRVTSGLAMLLSLYLTLRAPRLYEAGHKVRFWSKVGLFFMILEALIGAIIVLKGYVADNQSLARAYYVAFHLANTLLLIGSQAALVWHAQDQRQIKPSVWLDRGKYRPWLKLGLFGMLCVSAGGAVVALGDTLFPATSLADGLAQDFAPDAHPLIRLRWLHPVSAIAVGILICTIAARIWALGTHIHQRYARNICVLIFVQWLVGFSNVILLAPVWIQLLHLLLADILWIQIVLLHESLRPQQT